jgi:hypothetical protein
LTDPPDHNAPSDEHKTDVVDTAKKEKPEAGCTNDSAGHTEKRKHTVLERIAFGVAFLALCATAWQAHVANDTEKRTLRAYIINESIVMHNIDDDITQIDPTKALSVTITTKNYGQTPAYNVRGVSTLRIDNFPPVPSFFILPQKPNNQSVSTGTLAPQGIFIRDLKADPPVALTLLQKQLFKARKLAVYVFGNSITTILSAIIGALGIAVTRAAIQDSTGRTCPSWTAATKQIKTVTNHRTQRFPRGSRRKAQACGSS